MISITLIECVVKTLELIWRWGIRRFHLRMSDLEAWLCDKVSGPSNGHHKLTYSRLSIYRGYIQYDSAPSTTITMVKLRPDLHSRKTPHSSPLRASYGVSFVSYTKKNDRYIERAHCTEVWRSRETCVPVEGSVMKRTLLIISAFASHYTALYFRSFTVIINKAG